jgi:hypothetical protein
MIQQMERENKNRTRTVVELGNQVAENLYKKMLEVNKVKNLVNQMLGIKQVRKWIAQAKKLPRAVSY